MSEAERTLGRELEERLRFEALMSQLSARFINLATDQVDAAIEDAQRLMCEHLDLDRSSLFQRVEGEAEMLLLTHLYQNTNKPLLERRPEPALHGSCYWIAADDRQPPTFKRLDARISAPWIFEQMRRGETVILSSLEDIPAEAKIDRELLRHYGTESSVVVPLAIGGMWLGCLSFAAIRRPRVWSEPLVNRFRFLADVFTNALARKRADETLRESENRYRAIFETESDAVLLGDLETGRFVDANAAAQKLYGYTLQEFQQLRNLDISAEPEKTLESIASRETQVPIRWHRRKNGEKFPVELSASFADIRGRKGYVAAIREITQRKQAEDALRESEARLSLAIDSAGAGLWSVKLRTRQVWFSPKMREMFQFTPEQEITYELVLNRIFPEDRRMVTENVERALAQGREILVEHRIRLPDGSIRWVTNRGRFHFDSSGVPDRLMGASIDGTERKLAQERLEQSEQRFRQMAENIREVFYVSDLRQPVIEYVSPMYEELWGRSCQSLYADPLSFLEGVHREDRARVEEAAIKAVGGEPTDQQYRVVRPDGSLRWVRDLAFPVVDSAGAVARVTGLIEDITERKRAESLLRETEARFRTVADSAPVLVWMSGPDKGCTFCNKPWLDFTGRTAEQELGDGWAESLHPDDAAGCLHQYCEAFDSRRPFIMQYRLRRHDGEYRWVNDHGVPLYHADGTFAGYIGSCVDVTELTLALKALQSSEERFRYLIEQSPISIMMSRNGVMMYANKQYLETFGFAEMIEIENRPIMAHWAPEFRPDIERIAQEFSEGQASQAEFEGVSLRKDGSRLAVHATIARLNLSDGPAEIAFVLDISARKRTEEALQNSLTEIRELRDRLQAETEYLRAEIKVTESFGEIVGQSRAINKVLHDVEQVAPAECPVLITGETGTGKELVARAIHRLSPRRERAMVKVNCAALPSTLIESELFGRERGAFTGAVSSQAGRFEVADGSTIFLDEVAELSPEVQAKLLRVLQEGEFERLGSPRTRHVNTRVIAATNRNLAEEVQQGRFRQDLYYRLSVFPIKVPPLRERAEDIPAMVSTFVAEFSARMGKKVTKLTRQTMSMLQNYSWPGNIRELRNVLEHGVILSTDEVLRIPPFTDPNPAVARLATLAETEREHILKVFEKTGGRIKGPQGAAELLGMHPATLYSRMRKLGISRKQKDAPSSRG